MALPLEGINVLDLSRMAPGPFCTMVLADLGADVLKVEEVGISGRRAAVAGAEKGANWLNRSERDAAYDATGRNKKSIALNLKMPPAREIFYELARGADVIVEEFRPGVVKRLGVDYETIKGINPQIVYLSVTGYGQTGPYRDMVGHDLNYISIAGAQGMIGTPDGQHAIPLNLLADYAGGGLTAAVAVLAALVGRQATGEGRYVDVAMTDGVVYLMAQTFADYFSKGSFSPRGKGRLDGGDPRYAIYRTKDEKYICLATLEPWFYEALCKAMGLEHLAPFREMGEHDDEVRSALEKAFLTRTRDEWFEILSRDDTCVGNVYSPDEVASDPQIRQREMIIEADHPSLGKVRQVGIPFKYAGASLGLRSFAPLHGQNTREILEGLGYSPERIDALRREGAIK
ncbi:MAG: CaiB/BaiF CoA-transferase family protein [Dehalococcoidia bacterium]